MMHYLVSDDITGTAGATQGRLRNSESRLAWNDLEVSRSTTFVGSRQLRADISGG